MIDFLATGLGRLKTLVDRLTSTWAAQLDTLAARLSSTWAAKLDTLASNFTSTISGRIDAAISSRAPATSPSLTPPMASGIVPYNDGYGVGQINMGATIPTSWKGWISHASGNVGTTFSDVVNITGSGIVSFAAVQLAVSGSSATLYMDVIIDEATTISFSGTSASAVVGAGPALIGAIGGNATYGFTPVFEPIPFNTSLQIRVKSSSATYTAQGCARVRRNS